MRAARALLRRRERERLGRFLVEGAQAVREALRYGAVRELFVTERAAGRHPELVHPRDLPSGAAPRVALITERAAAALSETATPQGVVAVCELLGVPAADVLRVPPGSAAPGSAAPDSAALTAQLPAGSPIRPAAGLDTRAPAQLVAVLVGVSDPGNAGTVIRVADAAGADAVLFTAGSVDPHNGKCVRASTGSVFHLPLGIEPDPLRAVELCRQAGLRVLAADSSAAHNLDELVDTGILAHPTAWLFGSEAHGLPAEVLAAADRAVAIPLYGRAESLNLATAAAVCLYASARAQRRHGGPSAGRTNSSGGTTPGDRAPVSTGARATAQYLGHYDLSS